MEAKPVFNGKNILGEGPVLNRDRRGIRWTDIVSNKLYFLDTGTGETTETELPCYCAAMGVGTSGSLVAATGLGWVSWDGKSGALEPLAREPFDSALVRFNDGKTGPDGAFWVGTMDLNACEPVASLYRLSRNNDGTFSAREAERGLIISNGIGWSPDARFMYLTDTGRGRIYRYDFDRTDGSIGNRIDFIHDTQRPGVPDGLAVDEEGGIWSARWGGGMIARYNREGRCTMEVKVPAIQPTSCCFAGENLEKLYITSARYGLDDVVVTEYDGAVFVCEPGVLGADVPLFNI